VNGKRHAFDIGLFHLNFFDENQVFLQSDCVSRNDAPPNSLKNSYVNSKVKNNGRRVVVRSLTRSTLGGVKGHVEAPGWELG
jgi:hypothetical protein